MIRITLTVAEQEGAKADADGQRPVAVWCDVRGLASAGEREVVQKLGTAINAQMREWSHPGFDFMEQRRARA